ncbi:MAG: nucleotidyltransferase family protein [Anaerolineales bacterium]|nr:nucleotidyltransferase family protein [Anaerolineales bacterium]
MNSPTQAPTLAALRARRSEILDLAARYGATNVRIFGSVARGEATPDSDVDLLMAFQAGTSLYELSALWQALQELLACRVNIISEGGLKERFKCHIEKDIVPL